MTWLDENGNEVNGAVEGTDPVDFKITVDLVSSSLPTMNIRSTNVAITITNADVGWLFLASPKQLVFPRPLPISDDGEANTVD